VVEHRVYRRTSEEEEWNVVARSVGTSLTTFYDTTVTRNTLYEYAVEAVDDAGLASARSNTVTARPFDSGIRPPITELRYTIDSANGTILLRWDYPGSATEFYLYKGIDEDGMTLYRSIPSETREFADDEIASGTRYRYGIKAVMADGGESPLTATGPIALH
jgi:fibronectin type 3 domain-containing protein